MFSGVQEGDVVGDASVKAVLHYQLGTLFRDTLDQPCFVSQVALLLLVSFAAVAVSRAAAVSTTA